jgi:hypothetical protein
MVIFAPDHTGWHTQTHGRTPLNEWSVHRGDLYLTTHNTHKSQTSMPSAGFEPADAASERSQASVLDRAVTALGSFLIMEKLSTCLTVVTCLSHVRSPSKTSLVIGFSLWFSESPENAGMVLELRVHRPFPVPFLFWQPSNQISFDAVSLQQLIQHY